VVVEEIDGELPEKPPSFLHVTWADAETGARGHLVVDRLVGGIATGGTRMRVGCSVQEVTDLASEMSLKMGAYGIPVGGAKGGIDFDPRDPRAEQVRLRFVQAMRPLLEHYWVTAGDLGTPQDAYDVAFAEAGLGGTSLFAALVRADDPDAFRSRVQRAFTERFDGLSMSELIGGYGVAEAALAGLDHLGMPRSQATAVVQGFGAMGGSTALYLSRAGVKVVGIADADGLIVNTTRGLDVARLLASRNADGMINRAALSPNDAEIDGRAWFSMEVDVLVPAAVSYVITEENCEQVRARLVVEAANLPTTAGAERRLLERGTYVIPDFVANSGAAAWAWWVILDEYDGPAGSQERLASEVQLLVRSLMGSTKDTGVSIRAAGVRRSREGIARMVQEHGEIVAKTPLFSRVSRGTTL
jgi:glutamate dehydrogenase (NAD(P)+)